MSKEARCHPSSLGNTFSNRSIHAILAQHWPFVQALTSLSEDVVHHIDNYHDRTDLPRHVPSHELCRPDLLHSPDAIVCGVLAGHSPDHAFSIGPEV